MEGREVDLKELIDLDTSCLGPMGAHTFISSKPLIPIPPSPFGVCDYGINPFDQLMEMTRKSDNDKDDPFEIVSKKAFGNKILETSSEVAATSYNSVNLVQLKRRLQDADVVKHPKSPPHKIANVKLLEGLAISGNDSYHSNYVFEDSDSVKREDTIVETGKLVDLPSPPNIYEAKDIVITNKLARTYSVDFKCNSPISDNESNISKTNTLKAPETDDPNREALFSYMRKNSAPHEMVKAIIANRVEKCIQKALTDSRKLFRSKSVPDLHFCEPKTEKFNMWQSSSYAAKFHLVNEADNVILHKNVTEAKHNICGVIDHNGSSSDTESKNNCTDVREWFSRSFDDMYSDINQMKTKANCTKSLLRKLKETVAEMSSSKCATLFGTHLGSLEQSNEEELLFPAANMENDISSSSLFLEAHSLSLMLGEADGAEKYENLANIKAPWEDEYYEELIIETKDKDIIPVGDKKPINSDATGHVKLKSDNSKDLSDSNMSIHKSVLMNPISHSTPVFQQDSTGQSVLPCDAKHSPLLAIVPVLNNSYTVLTQKLRPLMCVSEQKERRGPLKAVTPVVSMTRNLRKGQKLTKGIFHGAPGQNQIKPERSPTSKVVAPPVIKKKNAVHLL